MAQRYDTVVIGGGMAGLPIALRAARHGRARSSRRRPWVGPASTGVASRPRR